MKILPHFPADIFIVLARLVSLTIQIKISEILESAINILTAFYLKNTLTQFDVLQDKFSEISRHPLDQTRVVKSTDYTAELLFFAIDIKQNNHAIIFDPQSHNDYISG
jgi:hypothetical protein